MFSRAINGHEACLPPRRHTGLSLLPIAAGLLVGGVAAAEPGERASADSCEVALALSALPARLRDEATVYLWKDDAWKPVGRSDGTFHCLVARNHPDAVIPQCFSRSGIDSILEGEFFKSGLVLGGASPDSVADAFNEKVEAGEFKAPGAPGINYMMSGFNWIYQSSRKEFIAVPPHVMFFAPHVEADEVGGASFQEAVGTKGLPMVVDAGIHAYMVTFTDGASDSSDVTEACRDHELVSRLSAAR